jgi:hypothetical protein
MARLVVALVALAVMSVGSMYWASAQGGSERIQPARLSGAAAGLSGLYVAGDNAVTGPGAGGGADARQADLERPESKDASNPGDDAAGTVE